MSLEQSFQDDDALPTSWPERLLDGIFQPNILLAAAVAVAAFVFLPKLNRVLPDLRNSDQYRLPSSRIEITPPPVWVPANLVEQVIRQANFPKELSLLDDVVVQKVARAFEQHPWIKGGVKIRTSVPARMFVEAEYREPVAMVRVPNGLFPIDGDAVLLPSKDFTDAQTRAYPVIEGITSMPRQSAGHAWGDASVLGGARLCVLLKPHWQAFGFQSVKALPLAAAEAMSSDGLNFQLCTLGGSRVIWGRSPDSRHPGELPAEKKIDRIKFYLSHHGPFDSPHGPYEFDITQWKEISRIPIVGAAHEPRR